MQPLLAKSPPKNHPTRIVTLYAHLSQTEQAARAIFKPGSRTLEAWLRFFRLDKEQEATFLMHIIVAGLLHDIGKANKDFQGLVTHTLIGAQSVRHEHFSAMLLFLPEMSAWLKEKLDLDILAAAVLSHHCKASDQQGTWPWCNTHARSQVELFLQHPEVQQTLQRIAAIAGLSSPPALPDSVWNLKDPLWENTKRTSLQAAMRFRPTLLERNNPQRYRLHLAVKAGLVAADTVASGLIREGLDIDSWLDNELHTDDLTPERVDADILGPRAKEIEKKSGKPFAYHRFQEQAADLGERGLLLAACGTGKTLAAWRWARELLKEHRAGRVIFLYPTRGTATEGFRDYVGWAPEGTAELLTGTARFDLEGMMQNMPDSLQGKDPLYDMEQNDRLYALRLWNKQYFSATVDQFLSFLEHHYRGLCLLPILADSLIILDEVHSYDYGMFDKLVAFLKQFQVPVLCMTATLPPSRQTQLIKLGLQVYPNEAQRQAMVDLKQKEEMPRYLLHEINDAQTALAIACNAYQQGKKVLWVVNTVARCQHAAQALTAQLGHTPLIYHSRYKLEDRRKCHENTIAAFTQQGQAAIAVTTQVCEMSLDLDADVLITEMAPITALVQRFGRANRHPERRQGALGELFVYPPEGAAPYTPEDFKSARQFITNLQGKLEPSQRDLSDQLEQLAPKEHAAKGVAGFLESGYYAVAAGFREDDGSSCSAVLDSELSQVLHDLDQKPKISVDKFIIPAPRKLTQEDSRLPNYLRVVEASRYSPIFGLWVDRVSP